MKIIYLAVFVFAKMELHRYIYITLLCPLIRIYIFFFKYTEVFKAYNMKNIIIKLIVITKINNKIEYTCFFYYYY